MLKRTSSIRSSRASTRTWPAISPAVRFRSIPIFPVRQNAHFIAQPTCVEMQKVCDGVSGMKTDSICLPSASRSSSLVVPSIERSRADDLGCVDLDFGRQPLTHLAAEVGHQREIGHAALVNPLEDLPAMEARVAEADEFLLNFVQFEAGEIGLGSHGVGLTRCAENPDCTMGRLDPN